MPTLLLATTKLNQSNAFTPVCQLFCSQGEGSLSQGNPPLDRDPLHMVMSGQYATYWNAFLFVNLNMENAKTHFVNDVTLSPQTLFNPI